MHQLNDAELDAMLPLYPGHDYRHLRAAIAQAREANRLRDGKFTPDELQNLCHNLTDADRKAFFDGCASEQRKLFGRCERDELVSLRFKLADRVDAHDIDGKALMALGEENRRLREILTTFPGFGCGEYDTIERWAKQRNAALAPSAPATEAPAPQAIKVDEAEAIGWPEDWPHENGKYLCRCHKCQRIFLGYKRRVVCKPCAVAPQALPWRKVAEGMPAKDDCVVWQMAYVDAFAFGWFDGDKVRFDDGEESLAVERFTHWLPLTPPADAGAEVTP